MGRATRNDGRLRGLIEELEVIRPDDPSAVGGVLAKLREVWEVEAVACVSTVPTTAGWMVDRFVADNLPNPSRLRALTAAWLANDTAPWFFNPTPPEPGQRNVLVDLRARVP